MQRFLFEFPTAAVTDPHSVSIHAARCSDFYYHNHNQWKPVVRLFQSTLPDAAISIEPMEVEAND